MVANLLILISTVVTLLIPAGIVRADSGYSITPAFQDADINTQPSQNLAVQIDNNTDHDQSFKLTASDFGSLNESGGVAFLGSTTDDFQRRYGLTSWLGIDHNVVFVPKQGSSKVIVTVQNRQSLSPGGHYGALLATAITDEGQPKAAAPQVGLHIVLSSLILLTKEGGAAPSLKLVSEDFGRNPAQLPGQISQRFQNAGNVHVTPRGIVEVRDPAGRLVKRGVLNESGGFVLPESFRRLPVELVSTSRAWLPGRYRITTTYSYIGSATTRTFTDAVWYAGTAAVVVAWLVLGAGLVMAGGWLWYRRRVKRS
jgi:hypothetical protein